MRKELVIQISEKPDICALASKAVNDNLRTEKKF